MLLTRLFAVIPVCSFLIAISPFQIQAMDEELSLFKIRTLRQALEVEKDVLSIMNKKFDQAYGLKIELKEGSEKVKKICEKLSFDPQTRNLIYIRPTDWNRVERVLDELTLNKILKQAEAQEIKNDLNQNKTLEEKKKLFDNHEFLKSISYSACTQQSYYVEIETKKAFPNIQKQLKEKEFWAETDTLFGTDLVVVQKKIELFLDVFVSNGLIQKSTKNLILTAF